jgi:hypothetical protein
LTEDEIKLAHKHSSNHRNEVEKSEICGCFYCCETFSPSDIEEWIDEIGTGGQTALCPKCGIDSVIGSGSGFQINEFFLKEMNRYWFRLTSLKWIFNFVELLKNLIFDRI